MALQLLNLSDRLKASLQYFSKAVIVTLESYSRSSRTFKTNYPGLDLVRDSTVMSGGIWSRLRRLGPWLPP